MSMNTFQDSVLSNLEHLFGDSNKKILFETSLNKVLLASFFIRDQIITNPNILKSLIESCSLFEKLSTNRYDNEICNLISSLNVVDDLYKVLRCYRNKEMVRIAWRDIAGWSDIDETMSDLTLLAEAFIGRTLDYLFKNSCDKIGTPITAVGKIQNLVVLGMGKLGAWELNFSSDIDLIFFYEFDGTIIGKKTTSFYEFYSKLAQLLISALDAITAHGFVFRVDTRLRPFGESGPIVMNFDGVENYYHGQAREWERYAMVKARVVAGDIDAGQRLQNIITPFVYRRYLDYRAYGELRQLKHKITHELHRKVKKDNIKLGLGGIREIEFIGQVFQLVRGGQDKTLRERNIQKVLRIIGQLGYLPEDIVSKLIQSYRFLRLVENRLQQYEDKQIHDLPNNESQCLNLALSLDFNNFDEFNTKLEGVRKFVHQIFCQVIKSSNSSVDEQVDFDWIDADIQNIQAYLDNYGFPNSNEMSKSYFNFQQSYSVRKITRKGIIELNRLMSLVVPQLIKHDNPSETFNRLLQLFESIAGRNVYFTLLIENQLALIQLIKLSSSSSWIVKYISSFPILLDELLDPRTLFTPLTCVCLAKQLKYSLDQIDVDDIEQLMTVLRKFKQTNTLRIAAAEIMDVIPIMVVSDYLTWLAETILICVLQQAWRLTALKYGNPPDSTSNEIKSFGVIAYGKMGGVELSYSSDLDLVFLYESVNDCTLTSGPNPTSCVEFYTRLVKRLVAIFTTQTFSGSLYDIDLRLRPSGNSGLLVSSLDSYEKYQMESAWTWEQQSIVRARFVAGDPAIAERFLDIRQRSLCRKRDTNVLKKEINEMRDKMRENLEVKIPSHFDIKQAQGGISDIEFIVQYGVLNYAHTNQSLTQWTDVVRLIDSLRKVEFFDQDEADILKDAYCRFREQVHRSALLEKSAVAPEEEFSEIRAKVKQLWRAKIECP